MSPARACAHHVANHSQKGQGGRRGDGDKERSMGAVLAWPGRKPENPEPENGAPNTARAAAATFAARDWLETQARVVAYWRDLLVESGGDPDLVAALDAHAEFLAEAGRG
jgi:hypothetical protein